MSDLTKANLKFLGFFVLTLLLYFMTGLVIYMIFTRGLVFTVIIWYAIIDVWMTYITRLKFCDARELYHKWRDELADFMALEQRVLTVKKLEPGPKVIERIVYVPVYMGERYEPKQLAAPEWNGSGQSAIVKPDEIDPEMQINHITEEVYRRVRVEYDINMTGVRDGE
jgi:hypothetical protein